MAIERQIIRAMLGGVAISVHVQPRASRTEAAARQCDVSLSAVEILSGAGARQKRVLVKGRSVEQVRERFQLEADGPR